MLWLTLTFLGLAIAVRWFVQTQSDETEQFLGILVAAIFLTISIANAPVLLQGLALLWLLFEPKLLRQRRLRLSEPPSIPVVYRNPPSRQDRSSV